MALLLSPGGILGGVPSQPLDLGPATRVVSPSRRAALAGPDSGGVVPGWGRPLTWREARHLWHWLDGGPTDPTNRILANRILANRILANLALVCRAHHRAVHDGGWGLARAPDGRLTATPPHRPPHRRHRHRRHPTAA